MEPPREGGGGVPEMAAALRAAKRALRAELRQRLRAMGTAEKQRQSRLLSRKVGASRGPAVTRRLPGRAEHRGRAGRMKEAGPAPALRGEARRGVSEPRREPRRGLGAAASSSDPSWSSGGHLAIAVPLPKAAAALPGRDQAGAGRWKRTGLRFQGFGVAAAGEGHGGVGTCSAVQPGAGGLHVAVGWLLILKCSRRPGFTASPVSKLSDWLILAFHLTGCNCPSVSFGVFLPCNMISNVIFIL